MTASIATLLGPLIALTVAHLVTVGLFLWFRSRQGDGPDRSIEGARVAREECGADNHHGYRCCRHCVAELPGPSPYASSGRSPRPVSPF